MGQERVLWTLALPLFRFKQAAFGYGDHGWMIIPDDHRLVGFRAAAGHLVLRGPYDSVLVADTLGSIVALAALSIMVVLRKPSTTMLYRTNKSGQLFHNWRLPNSTATECGASISARLTR